MISLIKNIFSGILSLLPDSPFQTMLDGEIFQLDFLPWLNWFIPFDNFLEITELWLPCIIAYYVYSYAKDIINKLIIDKLSS